VHARLCRRRWVAAVAVAVVLPLAFAGCSNGDRSSGGNAPCDAPGVTPTEVKIGLIYPDTGGAVADGFRGARSGVDARIGLANASGGVHGRQISYVWRDDQGKGDNFATAARELVDDVGVFGLVAETIAVQGTADRLDKQGIPVAGLAAEPVWGEHRNMFTFGSFYSNGPSVSTFGLYAKRQGGTRAVLVQDPLTPSSGRIAAKIGESLASQGIPVVRTIDYTDGTTSPAQVAAAVRDSKADTLIGGMAGEAFVRVFEATKAARLRLNVALNPSGYNPGLVAQHGAAIAGLSVLINYLPFDQRTAALDTYRSAMKRFAPELDDTDQQVAVASYITTDEFIRGLELAGPCPTRQGFINGLRGLKHYDAGGLIPDTDLSLVGQLNLCYAFVRVNDAGTRFDVVQNQGAPNPKQWCGQRLGQG
jgi:branched-chain amino acid transport system substrate-binding protein